MVKRPSWASPPSPSNKLLIYVVPSWLLHPGRLKLVHQPSHLFAFFRKPFIYLCVYMVFSADSRNVVLRVAAMKVLEVREFKRETEETVLLALGAFQFRCFYEASNMIWSFDLSLFCLLFLSSKAGSCNAFSYCMDYGRYYMWNSWPSVFFFFHELGTQ